MNLKLEKLLKANVKELNTQSKWRIEMSKLKSRVESLPCATKYGTDLPGMVKLRDRFLSQLVQREQEMNREMARVNQTVDWLPPSSFFDMYDLKASVHKNVVALCEAHMLDLKTIDKQVVNLFGACDYARGYWEPVATNPGNFAKAEADKRADAYAKALKDVKDAMDKMQPKYSIKHPRVGDRHDGMSAYQTSIKLRIGGDTSGYIKDLRAKHLANTEKYKKVT